MSPHFVMWERLWLRKLQATSPSFPAVRGGCGSKLGKLPPAPRASLCLLQHSFQIPPLRCRGTVFSPTTERAGELIWHWKHLTSLVAQTVKNLPAMQETQVRSLGWEDPLDKEMATHSSILAWRIPWKEEPGRLQSMGLQRVRHDWAISLTHSQYILDNAGK